MIRTFKAGEWGCVIPHLNPRIRLSPSVRHEKIPTRLIHALWTRDGHAMRIYASHDHVKICKRISRIQEEYKKGPKLVNNGSTRVQNGTIFGSQMG